MTSSIHPSAIIHPKAKIGKDVRIEAYAIIEENTEIGEGSWIGYHALILKGAKIGKNCQIYPSASIACIPQDLKFKGEESFAIIKDGSIIREYVTISRGTGDQSKTIVGENCLLMAYTHIAHDCIVGKHCILSNNSQIGGHVIIQDWATLGGSCAARQFVRIGCQAMVVGGAYITKDIPPYAFTTIGYPVRFLGINVIGLTRRDFTNEKINHIKEIYRYIYSTGLNHSEAIAEIEKKIDDSSEKQSILTFLKDSEIGIIRA